MKIDDLLKTINHANCLPGWIAKVFGQEGNGLKILAPYHYPIRDKKLATIEDKPDIPGWFKGWHTAALTAYGSDEWEITTGSIVDIGDTALLEIDNVSVGMFDGEKKWVPSPTVARKGSRNGGITVPAADRVTALNSTGNPALRYRSVVVREGKRGSIVVANRIVGSDGKTRPATNDQIVSTLLHELLHAGRMSGNQSNADGDKDFEQIAGPIRDDFDCRVISPK